MQARYQSGSQARFLSQDSVFKAFGDMKGMESISNQKFEVMLLNPNAFNSYSYANNNPLKNTDKNGNWSESQIQGANYLYENSSIWKTAMDHPIMTGAAVGVGVGAAVYGAAAGLTAASVQYLGGAGTACLSFCNKAAETAQKISISADRYQHVLDRHGYDTLQKDVSIFNKNVDIKSLIESTSNVAPEIRPNGYLQRIVDTGRNIGTDATTGKPTSNLTVITNKLNQLVTSHPGLPRNIKLK